MWWNDDLPGVLPKNYTQSVMFSYDTLITASVAETSGFRTDERSVAT